MNLHEYQAKQLFRSYGIAVSNGVASDSVEGAKEAALSLGGIAGLSKLKFTQEEEVKLVELSWLMIFKG